MRFRLQTDYAIRVLLFLSFVERKSTAEELAKVFAISRNHVLKVVQQLVRLGYVRTRAGRNGGMLLARDPRLITVREVVEAFESRSGILDCFEAPDVCPLEPGCGLRSVLRKAEEAFYAVLENATIEELCGRESNDGGFHNLVQCGVLQSSEGDEEKQRG